MDHVSPLDLDDTIVAPATPPGGAPRAVIRITGPGAVRLLTPLFPDIPSDAIRQPKVIRSRLTLEPGRELPLDLFIWPDQRSFTRQPLVEAHLEGSLPLVDWVVEILCRAGARLARPGEFTLRAFLGGRLDLTQAEAILGAIDADDAASLQAALKQLAGGLAAPLVALRSDLLNLLADLEAGLDFVDEDLEFISTEETLRRLSGAAELTRGTLEQLGERETLGTAALVVLRGLPNVGKSSLANALAEREASLVSPTPGATRDYVPSFVAWDGLELALVDTAGIEEIDAASDSIKAQAQSLGREQASRAVVELFCVDSSRPLAAWERDQLAAEEARRIVVWTKSDLEGTDLGATEVASGLFGLRVSVVDGRGLEALKAAVVERLVQPATGEAVAGTAIRCRGSLERAAAALRAATELTAAAAGDELVVAELRVALDALGEVVGAVYTNDLLDRIFSRFCIGK